MRLHFPRQLVMSLAVLSFMLLSVPFGIFAAETVSGLSSPSQIDYKSLSKRVEQIETKDAFQLGAKELSQKIEPVKNDLEAYIAAHDTDVDAMVLSVRLGFIEEVFVKGREKKSEQYINPEHKFVAQHKRLDRALELRPDNARANYWKARLYGMNASVIDMQGELKMQPIDLGRAIHFAKQAVMLDGENTWYREALAVYHIIAGDRKAALDVLDTSATAYNPLNVLLKDIEAFPLPEGSVYSQEDSESYSELQLKQKTITNYPQIRSQVFVVPMSAARLEKHFQETWPEFRFFKQGRDDLYAQYLIFDAKGLRPTYNMAEARAWAQKKLGGIILSVMDVKNPTAVEREMTPAGHRLPADLGDKFSYVFYVNNRNVE